MPRKWRGRTIKEPKIHYLIEVLGIPREEIAVKLGYNPSKYVGDVITHLTYSGYTDGKGHEKRLPDKRRGRLNEIYEEYLQQGPRKKKSTRKKSSKKWTREKVYVTVREFIEDAFDVEFFMTFVNGEVENKSASEIKEDILKFLDVIEKSGEKGLQYSLFELDYGVTKYSKKKIEQYVKNSPHVHYFLGVYYFTKDDVHRLLAIMRIGLMLGVNKMKMGQRVKEILEMIEGRGLL